jgi:8-oxo-dGTP pyrophosphatase MutT (NUDIX family)
MANQKNTSHGVLLFTLSDKDDILFLVAKRRYTYAYVEFLFRKNKRERQDLIEDMTLREIAQLITYKFEKLWEDFHLESFTSDSSFRKYAHELFLENVKKCRHQLLQAIEIPRGNEDKKMIWEFPKGKRNPGELGLECALREFKEETGIDPKGFVHIEDTFLENYVGDDERTYSTILYPMFVRDYKDLRIHRKKSKFALSKDYISAEVSSVKWMTRDECSKVLPVSKMKFVDFIVMIMKEVTKKVRRDDQN